MMLQSNAFENHNCAILKKTVLHGCFPPVDLVRRLLHGHSYQRVINARLNRY